LLGGGKAVLLEGVAVLLGDDAVLFAEYVGAGAICALPAGASPPNPAMAINKGINLNLFI
jgi:hypothetical protein